MIDPDQNICVAAGIHAASLGAPSTSGPLPPPPHGATASDASAVPTTKTTTTHTWSNRRGNTCPCRRFSYGSPGSIPSPPRTSSDILTPAMHLVRRFLLLLGSVVVAANVSPIAYTKQSTMARRDRGRNPGGSATLSVCKALSTAHRDQLELCARYPDVTASAMQGLRLAVNECQRQFRKNRWNCSTLRASKARSIHSSVIMSKGFRESAFMQALTSAGVAHAVARACSLGKLMSCGCGKATPEQTAESWRWSGCNHNMDFGIQFSKLFLDSREKAKDIQSRIVTHNNQVGRNFVVKSTKIKCKCHGMSGSCELKTCWRATGHFRRVGQALKDSYHEAALVDHTNNGHGNVLRLVSPRMRKSNRRRKKPLQSELVYIERSPSFCEPDPSVDSPGTLGRSCNKTSTDTDNCDFLCCGRGYNTLRQRRVERCECRFRWCCHVVCKECVYDEWVTVCK